MTVRTVLDTVLNGDGTPYADERVTFYLRRGSSSVVSTYPPAPVSVTTDEDGAYSADLWPNTEGMTPTTWLAVYPGNATIEFTLFPGAPISMSEIRAAGLIHTWSTPDLTVAMEAYRATWDANLTDEATTRATADTALQTNITSEATARAAADTVIQTQITNGAGGYSTLAARMSGIDTLPGAMRLASAPSAGATSISLRTAPEASGSGKLWAIIDPFTTECEIRPVTLSGATATVTALTYAHAADDAVLWTDTPIWNAKLFGAVGNGVADDIVPYTRAVAQMKATGVAGEIFAPRGEYLFSSSLSLSAASGREIPVFRGQGQEATNFKTTTDIPIFTMNASWKVQDMSFHGYVSGVGKGTGILVHSATRGTEIANCGFLQLGRGITTDTAPSSVMNHARIHHCRFEAISEYGAYVGDVMNLNTFEACEFYNFYPDNAGSHAATAAYVGYNSLTKFIDCSFATFKVGVRYEGSQKPILDMCYFVSTATNTVAYIQTDEAQAGSVNPGFDTRSLGIRDCEAEFTGDNTVPFLYARNTLNVTIQDCWSTAVGQGMLDVDTTVKGLVLINNRNDNSSTPMFTTADDGPNGSVLFRADINPTTGVPSTWLPQAVKGAANAAGSFAQTINMNGTDVAIFNGSGLAQFPTSLQIGSGATIPKTLKGQTTWNPGSLAANGGIESTTVTVTGAVTTDGVAFISLNSLTVGGIVLYGTVSATNTVTVTLRNDTAAPIDLGNGTLTVWTVRLS